MERLAEGVPAEYPHGVVRRHEVGLVILLPDPGGPTLVKTAQVCWTREPDYGLHLVALHPVEAARVERCVRHATIHVADAQY